MPLPPRSSGSFQPQAVRGPGSTAAIPVYEIIKARVLVRLNDRLDPSKSRRMPPSLFQQTARQLIEQTIEAEGSRLSRLERERLAEDVFSEAFGFGPLEELFRDATAKEIMILGPHAVVVRREQGWTPTNVKFRDEEQIRLILGRVATQGEAVAAGLPPSVIDAKLANGFRAVAVLPPEVLGTPATAVFVRPPDAPAAATPESGGTGMHPALSMGTGRVAPPNPRSGSVEVPAPGEQTLSRYRAKVTERIIVKLASLGVYDLSEVEIGELRRLVAAVVQEFCAAEKIYLSDTDQGRLTLEILTGMNR
jgi:hypothetical protein